MNTLKASETNEQPLSQLELDALRTAGTLVPLKSLRPAFTEDLFTHAAIQSVFAGEELFEDGMVDGQHIFLLSGDLELKYPNGRKVSLTAAECSLPIANRQPRPCVCKAETDCTVLRFDSDRLDRTLSWSQISDYLLSELSLHRDYDEDIEWMQTVLNSNLFLKAPPVNAGSIFSRLTALVVHAGEVIIRQGEIGDCCYFIKEGEAEVTVRNEDLRSTEVIAEIGPGRCFGEDALVNETVRNANVIMKSEGVLMRLEKSDFRLLLKEPAIDEITLKESDELMETPIFIDVRTEDEYKAGHKAFSANIPLALLSLKQRLLAPEKPYILYCDTGRRSLSGAYLLGKQGYNVMSLKGGINRSRLIDQLVDNENHILRNGELISGQ